ncbi:hypothetical protein [Polynucleobacter sp. UK-Kesae-W10]|uniref:hypothetical protein n=1 Tax=Polynucleobacter sp. UK-Kesae-W10 TaxID=1819738 RepID=UPI001C0B1006|nr:hypothetical protein [Polynucleobacter sp. UK-Kesae-W10]MBU3577766.1 hypothetical protein [Polynucleobacter sp. UK-Kesae-W10]
MNRFQLFVVFFCAVLSSPNVFAVDKTYRCQVLSDAYIQNNGELALVRDSSRIDQEFAVVKKTGEVIGDVMDSLKNPKVVAYGSDSNSYKVTWMQKSVGKNGVFLDYLNIEESAYGSQKPFGFFSGRLLLTGVCE